MVLLLIRSSSKNTGYLLRRAKTTWNGDSYQYLQQSRVPTLHFQKSLPRLPIPKLEASCERFLTSLQPIVSSENFERLKILVQDFQDGDGRALHKELTELDKQNKDTSYICGPWFDMYLSSRAPVVLNYNPFLVWKRDKSEPYNEQIVRASNLVISSLRFWKSLRDNVLEPMVYHLNPSKSDSQFYRSCMSLSPESLAWYSSFLFKAYPLDMSQFKNLFNTSRIPQQGKDEILYDESCRHVAVLYKGNFFVFNAVDDDGNIIPPNAIYANLSAIRSNTDSPSESPLGVLTTMERDGWAKARNILKDLGNKEVLCQIDAAIMLVVLDDEDVPTVSPDRRLDIAHHFLHGPAQNRWFDKSFSMIITKCGDACVNFEHSWGDGVAVLRYFNDVHKDSTENHHIHPGDKVETHLASVRKLQFHVDERIKQTLRKASNEYEALRRSLSLHAVEHEHVTRQFIKEQKLSPDAIFQLSFQLGFYKHRTCTPVTYESCSTSAFRHGRTETIRPATAETKRCVEAICSNRNVSPHVIRELIDTASKKHNNLTKEAAMGQGFDRHLFALKCLAVKNGGIPHPLFEDAEFLNNNTFTLSTSTLHGEAFVAGGFAPVVKNGFGLGYGMPEKNFGVLISAYEPHADGAEFARCLREGLDEIVNILHKCKK